MPRTLGVQTCLRANKSVVPLRVSLLRVLGRQRMSLTNDFAFTVNAACSTARAGIPDSFGERSVKPFLVLGISFIISYTVAAVTKCLQQVCVELTKTLLALF